MKVMKVMKCMKPKALASCSHACPAILDLWLWPFLIRVLDGPGSLRSLRLCLGAAPSLRSEAWENRQSAEVLLPREGLGCAVPPLKGPAALCELRASV